MNESHVVMPVRIKSKKMESKDTTISSAAESQEVKISMNPADFDEGGTV
jgi:hypothetical protein